MKYYKLIDDNKIVGAVSSNDFIQYSPIVDCFLRGSEETGEYISFQNKLYRTTWMCPIQIMLDYIPIQTIEITKEEYDIIIAAYESNQTIEEDTEDEEEEDENEVIDPIMQDTLEFIRSSKILEMSQACRHTIEEGFDLEIRGEIHHFSLTIQDQLNLMSLSSMTQTNSLIPYHADGEETAFYTAEEINQIINAAAEYKNYQTTYYNSLKTYINTLDTIEAIAAITYGTPIPDEYKSDVLKVLE